MTRRQWIGLAGVLFGGVMLAGMLLSGTTPDSEGASAAQRYAEYWADSENHDAATRGTLVLTYSVPLLVCLAAGLGWLLRRRDDGPLPGVVLAAGTAAAALLAVGGALVNGAGLAATETGFESNGHDALLTESIGYFALTGWVMCGATMAVAAAISNRRARVLPQWTAVVAALLGLVLVGSVFIAWVGFMLFPAWSVVIGGCLIATKEAATTDAPRETVAA